MSVSELKGKQPRPQFLEGNVPCRAVKTAAADARVLWDGPPSDQVSAMSTEFPSVTTSAAESGPFILTS